MPATTTQTREEAQISETMNTWAQELRARNLNAVMSHYAPDNVAFDLTPPLQVRGADAYRKNFETWFASVQGPIDYEIRDLHITTSDDVAFCHYLGHVKTRLTTGENSDYWVRVTSGFQRINGRWMATHEHVSVPFNMETKQALLDLQP